MLAQTLVAIGEKTQWNYMMVGPLLRPCFPPECFLSLQLSNREAVLLPGNRSGSRKLCLNSSIVGHVNNSFPEHDALLGLFLGTLLKSSDTQHSVGVLAHELRSPLSGIIGMTKLLAQTATLSRVQTEYLRNIEKCSYQLLEMVNDFLDFAKMSTIGVPPKVATDTFSVLELVQETTDVLFSKIHEKRLRVVTEVPRHLNVETDRKKMRQILMNLMSNSIKVSPANARLFIKARTHPKTLVVQVRDEGPGIPPEFWTKIFDPFVQLGGGAGTGLGLAIVKGLVAQLNGTVGVLESDPKYGTTMEIRLPGPSLEPEQPEQPEQPEPPEKPEQPEQPEQPEAPEKQDPEKDAEYVIVEPDKAKRLALIRRFRQEFGSETKLVVASDWEELDALNRARSGFQWIEYPEQTRFTHLQVWVVEDHAENRTVLVEYLKILGLKTCRAFENGLKAVEAFRTNVDVDVVLMDLRMPVMDGYEATKTLKKLAKKKNKTKDSKFTKPLVVATTAFLDQEKTECQKLGFSGFLAKPIMLEDLELLLKVLARKLSA